MRRVVLPLITATPVTANVASVATLDVGVAIEIVVVVDIYIATTPTCTPTPTTAPGRAHC